MRRLEAAKAERRIVLSALTIVFQRIAIDEYDVRQLARSQISELVAHLPA